MKKTIATLLIVLSGNQYGQTKLSDTLTRDEIIVQKENIISYVQKNSLFLKNNFDKKYTMIGDFLPVDQKSIKKLAKVSIDGCWGYIDEKGKEIIPPFYNYISEFNNGIAVITYYSDDAVFNKCEGLVNDKGEFLFTNCSEQTSSSILSDRKKNIFSQFPYTPYIRYSQPTGFGVINRDRKTVVPAQYKWITFEGQHFICHSQDEKTIDIYSEEGKLVFTAPGKYAYHIKDQYYSLMNSETGRYDLIDIISKRRIFQNFTGYNNPGNSKKISFRLHDYRNPNHFNDGENVYMADQNFKIINTDHPNAKNFEDQYLVQETTENNRLVYIILDFEGKVITKYNEYEYYLYNYFAPFRLNDPAFIQQNASRFSGYKEINRLDYNDPQYIGYFYSFHPYNESSHEPRIWKGIHFLNKKTSEIFLTLPPDKYRNPRIFDTGQVSVYNIPSERTEIYDLSGSMLFSMPFDASNDPKEKYFGISKGDSFNIADKKTHQLLFRNYYKDIKKIGDTGLFLVSNGTHYGILNDKGAIIRPFDQTYGYVNEKKSNHVYLTKSNRFESFNTVSGKTEICIQYDDENRSSGQYINGIYYRDNIAVDQYGNAFYKVQNEIVFRPYSSQ